MSRPNPKVVIQAHTLRSTATRTALLHGAERPRSERALVGLLWGSAIIGILVIGIVILATRIADLLHSAGH